MKKKKGSALVMTIVITSVLIVLSLSVLSLSASSYKNNIYYDRINQVRLLAESGIEQAIGQLKNGSSTVVADIKSADNFITCKVLIAPNTPQPNHYKIVSTATGGVHSKTITVEYKKGSSSGGTGNPGNGTSEQVSDLADNYLLKNAVSLISTGSQSVFQWPGGAGNSDNNAVNITGDFYVSGNFINFTPTEYSIDGDVIYSGDRTIIEQTKNNGKFRVHNGDTISTISSPAAIKPSTSYDVSPRLYPDSSGNLIVFNTKPSASTTRVNLTDIDSSINSIYGSKPGFSNIFKVIVVDGDLNILYGTYNNYIIYCTGNIFLDGSNSNNDRNAVNLNNSTICANKGITFDRKVNLNINYNRSAVSGAEDMIKSYLNESLGAAGSEGITDWQE